jgi:zinc transport system substrate-binding protein
MRRVVLLAMAIALLAACGGTDDPSVTAEQRGKPVIITGFRLLAEAAERAGGDAVVVIDLTPVGTSPHELELTARQRQEVLDADVAIVMGKGFQPDVEQAAAKRKGPTVDILDALALPDRPDNTAGEADPHVWLDPTLMGSIVTTIANAVAAVAPDDAGAIGRRAQKMVEEDVRLDAQLTQGLESCRSRVIASQHQAWGWFGARYGFTNLGFDGIVPDDDPAPEPAHLQAIEDAVAEGSVTSIFLETLTSTSYLEVVADEQGLDTAMLNPYEGLTLREDSKDVTYRRMMLTNLRTLQEQLDCERG